jgi:hypothetical protein
MTIPLLRKVCLSWPRLFLCGRRQTGRKIRPRVGAESDRVTPSHRGSENLAIWFPFAHWEPGMETEVSEQVKAVVDGFRRLANGEQTRAYIEIEAIWKTQKDNEQTERPPRRRKSRQARNQNECTARRPAPKPWPELRPALPWSSWLTGPIYAQRPRAGSNGWGQTVPAAKPSKVKRYGRAPRTSLIWTATPGPPAPMRGHRPSTDTTSAGSTPCSGLERSKRLWTRCGLPS